MKLLGLLQDFYINPRIFIEFSWSPLVYHSFSNPLGFHRVSVKPQCFYLVLWNLQLSQGFSSPWGNHRVFIKCLGFSLGFQGFPVISRIITFFKPLGFLQDFCETLGFHQVFTRDLELLQGFCKMARISCEPIRIFFKTKGSQFPKNIWY